MKKHTSNLPHWFDELSEKEQLKLLNDKFYLSQALSGHSYQSLQRSGWINHAYSLEEMSRAYSSIISQFEYHASQSNEIFILLNTGSYAPAHMGHVSLLKMAKERIIEEGLSDNPIMVLSPSHDKYVLEKSHDIKHWDINNRMKQLDKVVEDYPYKQEDDIFIIDPWESVYCDYPVNFTDVIIKYIKDLEALNIKFKIGYVFGSDNEEFLYAFSELPEEHKSKFYAICVERDSYPIKINSTAKNVFYVKNHEQFWGLKSRDLRKLPGNAYVKNTEGIYAVRHDARLALKNWIAKYPHHKDRLNISFDYFHNGLKNLVEKYTIMKSESIELEVQRELVKNYSKQFSCLNLDLGTNDIDSMIALNYGRVFIPGSIQKSPLKMIIRPEYQNIVREPIKPGNYAYIDDDIASGTTFSLISEILARDGVNFVEKINLAKSYCEYVGIEYHLFDIIDTKDFLFGSNTGGLICKIKNKDIRLPYFAKYVNLFTRASINYSDIKNFNNEVLELNEKFFKENEYLTLEDIHQDLRNETLPNKCLSIPITQAINLL